VIALLLVVLADLAPGPPESQCTQDSDCTIATMQSCCGNCCPGAPGAYPVKEAEAHLRECQKIDCEAPRCANKKCAAVESAADLEAVCRGKRCVAVHKVKPECSTDADCRVDYPPIDEHAACRSSPCGCCPNTSPIAVPVSMPVKSAPRPAPAPRPLTKKDEPRFGLSPGSTPPPQCSPCPAQEPARAICSERHCVLDRPHAL
jgi:hypothetical protein